MSPNPPKQNNLVIVELHPFELELIKRIREKYRFGEITIEIRNGLPDRVVKEVQFERLST